MLKQIVSSEIKKRFPNIDMELGSEDTNIIATIPPVHASWKPIVIYDNGNEITVFYGAFTHNHYKYFGEDAPATTKANAIAKDVLDELAMVFEDQIEFWQSRSMSGMGPIGSGQKISRIDKVTCAKLWSGKDVS